jgi:hypothetical protein
VNEATIHALIKRQLPGVSPDDLHILTARAVGRFETGYGIETMNDAVTTEIRHHRERKT